MSRPRPRWWPRSVYARAAVLMLGSTLSFAMMALTIRYATRTIPTTANAPTVEKP